MGIRELRARYGANLKSSVAFNAAIKAELPGGAELIEAIRLLRAFIEIYPDDRFARRALADLYKARAPLGDEIARRYDVASAREDNET